jgi:hypothetical protein
LALVAALFAASVLAADVFPILGHREAPSGYGWRLLSEVHDTSFPPTLGVRAATDRADFDVLWQELDGDDSPRTDFTDLPPWLAVNFEREIIVVFGVGIGSCTDTVQLDRVVIDRSTRLVYSVTSEQRHCGHLDLTGAAVFVVALDRGVLPPSRFTAQLRAESSPNPDDRLILTL